MPMLTELDLSHNSLTGTLPVSIGKLHGLMILYIICLEKFLHCGMVFLIWWCMLTCRTTDLNYTNIRTLDLGGNRFSGNIPTWIGQTMPSLWILGLGSNLFNGSIPLQLCTLSSLHILDLAQNNLSGSIPSCVGNLSAMASEIGSYRYEADLMVKGREDSYRNILYLVNSIDLSNKPIWRCAWRANKSFKIRHLELVYEPYNRKNTRQHWELTMVGKSRPLKKLAFWSNSSRHNLALCGRPITAKCPGDDGTPNPPGGDDEEDDEDGAEVEIKWFYMSMGTGFVVGFWGVCGTLVVKESWSLF
ncbi:hypothetical protein VitviT2T_022234 [Vitis vinifera]|nr:hypothetical protein VitviT2T_022234 [Vitis vinifera]